MTIQSDSFKVYGTQSVSKGLQIVFQIFFQPLLIRLTNCMIEAEQADSE